MKFVYPAVFHKTDKNTVQAYFPDFSGCEVEGENLDEAIEKANEALFDWITQELTEDEVLLPSISEEEDLTLKEGDIVRNISVNIRLYDGWDE